MSVFTSYKPGDILLCKASYPGWMKAIGWAQRFFDGKVGHCEVIYDICSDEQVICVGANFDGVKYRKHYIDNDIAIGRVKHIHMRNDVQEILRGYITLLANEGATKYSYWGLANAMFNAFMDKVTLSAWKKKSVWKNGAPPYCSEFVAEVMQIMKPGLKFSRPGETNIATNVITPSDIYESYQITMIKDFG